MEYRAYEPTHALRPWVRHVWVLEGQGDPGAEPIYPDGCMEIAIHLGDAFSDENGKQPHSLFIGQMTGPTRVHSNGRTLCVGIKFRPGGAAPFLPVRLNDATGRIVSLEAVWSRPSNLRERLGESANDSERVRWVEEALLARNPAAQHDPLLDRAIGQLMAGGARVDEVARLAGLSVRQLERRVRERAGAGPKLLARIARFQRALAQSQSPNPDWAAIAVTCGYYDQAHLIRDFRQFTGAPPTRGEPGSALGSPRGESVETGPDGSALF